MANILDLPGKAPAANPKPQPANRQKEAGGSGQEFAAKLSKADSKHDTDDETNVYGATTGANSDGSDLRINLPTTIEEISATSDESNPTEGTTQLRADMLVPEVTSGPHDTEILTATANTDVELIPPVVETSTDEVKAEADDKLSVDAEPVSIEADETAMAITDAQTEGADTAAQQQQIAAVQVAKTETSKGTVSAADKSAIAETRKAGSAKARHSDAATPGATETNTPAPTAEKTDTSATITKTAHTAPDTSLMAAQPATGQASMPTQATNTAAPATPAPALTMVPVAPAEVVNVLSHTLKSGDDGQDRVVVQLDPPELGRVSIDFKFDAQGLQTITVTGETPEAMRRMREMHFELINVLEQNGLSGQNLSFGDQPSQQQANHQIIFNQFKPGFTIDDTVQAAWSVAATPAAIQVRNTDALDIKV